MSSPTIVFLGASVDQSPSYRIAREMDFYIIGFDSNPNAFAFRFADETYVTSVRNYEEIEVILKARKIDAIYSPASDAARLSEYHLAKTFNTPKAISMESVQASMNKGYFLDTLQNIGLPHHTHIRSDKLHELKEAVKNWSYPFVVKPNDSSGSKGVRVVNSRVELEQALNNAQSFSPTKTVICEELVIGTHCSVDAFLRDSQVEFMTVAQKIMTDNPLMIPLHYVMPANISATTRTSMKDYVEKICQGLNIRSGPITCDVVVRHPDKAIHFIEMGARAGGNGISILMNQAYGVNYIDASLALHAGQYIPVRPSFYKYVALMTIVSTVTGRIDSIFGFEILVGEDIIIKYEMFYEPGHFVKKFQEGSHKLGYLVIEGDSANELYQKMKLVEQKLKICVENENAFLNNKLT